MSNCSRWRRTRLSRAARIPDSSSDVKMLEGFGIPGRSRSQSTSGPERSQVRLKTGILFIGRMDPFRTFPYLSGYSRMFAFQIDQTTGALSAVAGSPFALPKDEMPSQLVIGGAGTSLFLYADLSPSSGFIAGIAEFAINSSTGALSTIPGSPFQSEDAPGFLCVTLPVASCIALVPHSARGLPNQRVDGRAHASPQGRLIPQQLSEPSPSIKMGKFLYAANYQSSTIYGFNLDSATGSFASIPGSAVPRPSRNQTISLR